MTLNDCELIDLPKIADPRGNLTFVEERHIPFAIKRVLSLRRSRRCIAPATRTRRCHQFLIAMSGSFDVVGGRRRKGNSTSIGRTMGCTCLR